MAKDSEGRKYNRIPAYDRVQDGKVIHVPAHVRSNRIDCKGQRRKNDCSFLLGLCHDDVNRYGIFSILE